MSKKRYEVRFLQMNRADEWLEEQAQKRNDDEYGWEPFAAVDNYLWVRRITKAVEE